MERATLCGYHLQNQVCVCVCVGGGVAVAVASPVYHIVTFIFTKACETSSNICFLSGQIGIPEV